MAEEDKTGKHDTTGRSELSQSVLLVGKIVTFQFHDAAEIFVDKWINWYRKYPKSTAATTIIIGFATLSFIGFLSWRDAQLNEARRREGLDYSSQITTLRETQKNLQELVEFTETQQREIEATEKLLQSLETRREQIQPLIEAEEEIIEALFSEQESREQQVVWVERSISFGLGVLASLLATVIWFAVERLRERNIQEELPPES